MRDFTNEEIEAGDIVVRASVWDRSPALEWAIIVDLREIEEYGRKIKKVGIISSGNIRVGYTFPQRVLYADESWVPEEIKKELKEKLEKYNEQNRRKKR